jgi:hypothetical protein
MNTKTIGDLINEKAQNKAEIDSLNRQLKPLKEKREALDNQIKEVLIAEGQTRAGNKTASVSISESEHPSLTNKLAFLKWLRTTDTSVDILCALFNTKIIKTDTYQEAIQANIEIPGVETYVAQRVNFNRKATN